ncbi:MAG: efflux RND transporter periplasmic adaptor subunit [Gammaproteobacteria bacterium]
MKKTVYRLTLVALVIIAVIAGGWYLSRPKPIAVAVTAVERGTVEATVSNTRAGTVKACRRARLAPAIGGQIAKLAVKEGDRVKTGQVLLSLWNDDVTAQLQLAQRETTAARATADQTCLLANNAVREAKRLDALRKKGQVSEQQADNAQAQAQAGQASCRAARANVEVSAARVSVARAAVERTLLRAPVPGVVGEVNGELGEFVTPSPTGVATLPAVDLLDTSCLYIAAPIDEVDAPQIKTGMTARISLDAFPDKHFAGRVSRIAPYVLEVEKQARTVDVEAKFTDPADYRSLRPGYSADLEIIIAVKHDVLRIPTEAVLEGHRVLVYNPATHILEERRFKAGLSNWKYTEVLSGLSAGNLVVLSIDREGVKAGVRATLEKSQTAP